MGWRCAVDDHRFESFRIGAVIRDFDRRGGFASGVARGGCGLSGEHGESGPSGVRECLGGEGC